MGRKRPNGQCCICGKYGPLSFEHIPPEGAFNEQKILQADIDQLIAAQTYEESRSVRTRQNQRGAGAYTLCEQCNNDTGSWYVPAYIEWARQGWWNVYNNRGYIFHRPFDILPLAAAKQILAMFASACGPSLFEGHPDLRRFVLNRDVTGLPPEVRIFAYYISPASSASRQSGITGNMDLELGGSPRTYSEIAFPPFGYVLTLNSSPPHERLVDITFMAQASPNERRTLHLQLPGLEVHSYLPADFRSAAEIARAYQRSE